MRKTVLSGAIALSLLSLNAHALSVGEMNVSSRLGEALNVTINLNAASKSELSTLEVSLASRAAFEQAGIRYPETAEDLIIEVDTKQKGKPKILVKSFNSISEPFVHLLLQITWAGGNMLREYTALIDPAEYSPNPVAQAVTAGSKMGVAKPADASTTSKVHGLVKSGDSLSSIASLYRPADVSVHQAWMAFYELNRQAFPENNLNKLKKGVEIRIPTRTQMTAVSPSKAAQEVKKLSKPLGGVARAKAPTTKTAPKLVVGGDKEEPARAEAKPAQTPEPSAKAKQVTAAVDSEQIASVRAEFGEFKQDIDKQLSENSAQNAQFREELVAARGEGRILNERIGDLEKQLSNISRLVELQNEAMQAQSEAMQVQSEAMQALKDGQMQMAAAVDSVDTDVQRALETEPEQPAEAEPVAENTVEQDKEAVALDSAPPIAGDSSTDGNVPPADAETSGSDQIGTDGDAPQEGETQMVADLDEAQTNIAQSQQRIESLEKEIEQKYEERLEQEQNNVVAQVDTVPATSIETPQAEPQTTQSDNPVRVTTEPAAAPQPIVERSFMDKAMAMLGSIGALLAGISSDIWKIIGVIAAALLGLFAYNGARRRRAEQAEDDDYEFSTLEEVADADLEVGDSTSELLVDEKAISTLEADKSDEKLHGSSLFDLSDESFMASEAVDSDSSMFTMDEELGTTSDKMASRGSAATDLHSSIPTATDIDPLTEADVYLAYDRKEQAINVLEQALAKDPNQPKIVLKLLTLHRDADDTDAFTKVFESSAESIEDDEQWGDIKHLAQDFITTDKLLEDDFDSSIPVLRDELIESTPEEVPLNSTADTGVIEFDSTEREDHDDILEKAIQELENEESLTEIEPEALTLSDDMALSVEEEMENEASLSLDSDGIHGVDGEMLSDITHDIGLDIDREEDLGLDDGIDIAQINEADEPKAATVSEENLNEVSEINQHDPETALALANAYIELGENDIAKDFLNDVIAAGSKKVRGKAEKLLASLN